MNNAVFAMATSCQVKIGNVLKEISNKDSVGDWTEQAVLGQNWSIQAEAVIDTSITYGYTAADLKALIGSKMHVDFAQASGTHNATKGDMLITGFAILSDINFTAENRKRGTCQITLTGDGWLRIPRLLADVNGTVFITSNGKALVV